jgi:hypothetical protein
MMKDGFTRRALILPTASSSVPRALGLAGLSNPTWLSLIRFGSRRLADNAHRTRHAACDRPQDAGAGPGHAFQDLASADAAPVVVIRSHRESPLKPRPPPRHQIANEQGLFPSFRGCISLEMPQ